LYSQQENGKMLFGIYPMLKVYNNQPRWIFIIIIYNIDSFCTAVYTPVKLLPALLV
jgi:hypothetical protein